MCRVKEKEERIAANKDAKITKPEKITTIKGW
jgi:hypothetical protein